MKKNKNDDKIIQEVFKKLPSDFMYSLIVSNFGRRFATAELLAAAPTAGVSSTIF